MNEPDGKVGCAPFGIADNAATCFHVKDRRSHCRERAISFPSVLRTSSLLEREKSDCEIRDLSERNRRSLNLILFVILPFFRDSRCPRNERCRECDVKESEAGQFYFILFYLYFFLCFTNCFESVIVKNTLLSKNFEKFSDTSCIADSSRKKDF